MDKRQDQPDQPQADEPSEELTEELLERLLATASPEAYLAEVSTDDRSLADYLYDLMEARGMTRADVIRASKVNGTFVYQIFGGARHASRDNIIKMAFGLGCSLRETQRLLRHAGLSELWSKDRRDAIIIFCIDHGRTLAETDDELYRLGQPTLVPED